MLIVDSVSKSFGGVRALEKVSLAASPGTATGLIGPNGSGKSTLFNVLTGVVRSDSGRVLVDGVPLDRSRPDLVARAGVVRTFQIPRLVVRMTVLQNLMLGRRDLRGDRLLELFNPWARLRREEDEVIQDALEIAGRLALRSSLNKLAGQLSGGQAKLLTLGMALMARPKLLLLDEPVAGVSLALRTPIEEALMEQREAGVTLLIVEHNLRLITDLCESVYVLSAGSVIAHGTPDEVRRDPNVIDAYIGSKRRGSAA